MDAVTVSGLRLLKAIGIGTDAKAGVLGGTCHVLGHGGPWWDMVGHGRTWWDMLGHGGTWWDMVGHGGLQLDGQGSLISFHFSHLQAQFCVLFVVVLKS